MIMKILIRTKPRPELQKKYGSKNLSRLTAIALLVVVPFLLSACEEVSEAAMPNLVDMTLDEAKDALDNTGVSVNLNYLDVKEDRLVIRDKNWRVVRQEPTPGKIIKKDEIICLSLIKVEDPDMTVKGYKCLNLMKEEAASILSTTTSVPQTTSAPNTTVPTFSGAEYDSAAKQMLTSKDEVLGHTFLQDKSSPKYSNENGFYLYAGTSTGYVPWVRLVIQFTASDWIFWQKFTANVDGVIFTFKFGYSDVERDNNGYSVWERLDTEVSEEINLMLASIAKSNKTVIRLEGSSYSDDRVLTKSEKNAIANVLTVFDGLKKGKLNFSS